MENFDVKKVLGVTPTNQFEAIDLMNKAQQELIEALHIMQSALNFPEEKVIHENSMVKFYSKFL